MNSLPKTTHNRIDNEALAAWGKVESEDCIIHWDETAQRDHYGETHTTTKLTCKWCKKDRWIKTSSLYDCIKRHHFRGTCKACYDKEDGRRSELRIRMMLSKKEPVEERQDSFVHWHSAFRKNGVTYIKVVCKHCKTERTIQWQSIRRINSGKFGTTGLCPACNAKRHQGPLSVLWKGGRCINTRGYVDVYVPRDSPLYCMANKKTCKVMEHRIVMANKLGRPLSPYEHVHHLNGKKADNREDNLMLVNRTDHFLITRLENYIKRLEAAIKQHGLQLPQ